MGQDRGRASEPQGDDAAAPSAPSAPSWAMDERLAFALEAAGMGAWDWNVVTGEIAWSSGHEVLWGMPPGTFRGTREEFEDGVHPDDRAALARAMQVAMEGRGEYRHEFRVVGPDGSQRWIAGRGRFTYDAGGHPTRMFGVVTDVTEAHRAADARERLVAGERAAAAQAGESRAELARLLERVSDAFVALDRNWHYTYVNPQAAALFGRTPEQLIGKHIWTEFPEGIGQPFHRAYERAMAEQQSVAFEDHYAPWDRWFENRVYPSPDGLSIFFHEITDRKRAERAEKDAGELNRQIISSADEGIAVFDRELRCLAVNPALGRMTDLSPAEMVGHRPRDFVPSPMVEPMEARLRRALSGEVVHTPDQRLTRLKTGRTLYLSTLESPLRDGTGAICGVLAMVRDVTERVGSEAALRASDERLRLALEAAQAGVWDWDLVTEAIVVWSPEHGRLWGLEPGGFTGTYAEVVAGVHPGDRDGLDRAIRQAIDSRSSFRAEFRIRLPDGIERWIAGTGHSLHAADGTPVRMLGTVVEVTTRKRAELLVRCQSVICEMVAAGSPMSQTLDALVRGVESQAPGMLCSILLLDDAGLTLHHGAAPSLPPEYVQAIDGAAIGPDAGSCGTAAFTREPVETEDLETDPRWALYRHLARPHGLRACWSTPIFDEERRVQGTFAMYYRRPGLPEPWHREVIAMATHAAAVVLAARRSRDALQELSAQLLRSQDEERRRIARGLHDTTVQNLAALALNLTLLQRRTPPGNDAGRGLVDECALLVDRSAEELRTLSYLLHPPLLEDFGLYRAIEEYVEGFTRRSHVRVALEAPRDVGRLPGGIELALFRVLQESLTNVQRHSGSATASVHLVREVDHVTLEVRDAGRGAHLAAAAGAGTPRFGVGILGMRERLRHLGGQLEVSFRDDGTSVRAVVPLPEAPG